MNPLYLPSKKPSLRWRKEGFPFSGMFQGMDNLPKPRWTVGKVLHRYAQAEAFLSERHLRCAGCGFNRYCTLENVASSYHLECDSLVEDLRQICLTSSR